MIEFKKHKDVPKYFTGVCKLKCNNYIYHMKDGKCHNEFGPAVICKNGTKIWYINGLEHREDGPSTEYADGGKTWFYKGVYYGSNVEFTNESWKEKIEQLKREEELQIFL